MKIVRRLSINCINIATETMRSASGRAAYVTLSFSEGSRENEIVQN
jgi:hypothetical protein